MGYTLSMKEDLFEFAQEGEKAPLEKETNAQIGEKVETATYKVFGRDFSLTNTDYIDYYKTRMKMMAIKYRLVGRINDKAQYIIRDAIRYDLIRMEKEIDEAGEDYYKAIALYMKKHFLFQVKITPIQEGKAKASLYLSEYIEDFLGEEYITSHIADFVDVYDDDFRIKLRKAFNLVDVATKIDDFAVPDLAVAMQDCFDLEIVVGGLYDMASQIFLMRLLKELEGSGEVGAKVLARYRELLAKSKDIEIDEKFRNSHYKALLDRAIDDLGGYEKLGIDKNAIDLIIKDINSTIKAIDNVSGKGGYVEAEGPIKREDVSSTKSKSDGGGNKNKGGNTSSKGVSPKKSASTRKAKASTKTRSSGGVPADWADGIREIRSIGETPQTNQTTNEENKETFEENREAVQNPERVVEIEIDYDLGDEEEAYQSDEETLEQDDLPENPIEGEGRKENEGVEVEIDLEINLNGQQNDDEIVFEAEF